LSATARRGARWSRAIRTRCFLGSLQGEALAAVYAAADVFVFPSRTDTFGLVLLEALASGLPVAAFRSWARAMSSADAPVAVFERGSAFRLPLGASHFTTKPVWNLPAATPGRLPRAPLSTIWPKSAAVPAETEPVDFLPAQPASLLEI